MLSAAQSAPTHYLLQRRGGPVVRGQPRHSQARGYDTERPADCGSPRPAVPSTESPPLRPFAASHFAASLCISPLHGPLLSAVLCGPPHIVTSRQRLPFRAPAAPSSRFAAAEQARSRRPKLPRLSSALRLLSRCPQRPWRLTQPPRPPPGSRAAARCPVCRRATTFSTRARFVRAG